MSKPKAKPLPRVMKVIIAGKVLMGVAILTGAYYMFKRPVDETQVIVNLPGRQTAYSKANDGSYSYLDLYQAQSRVMLVKSGKTIEVLSKADMVSQSLSPSGRYIGVITLKRDNICRSFIYDLKTGQETEVAICSALYGSTLSWGDDDTLYFVAQKSQTSAIQSYNPSTHSAVEFYQWDHLASPTKLKSPNLLAFIQYDKKGRGTLMLLDEAGNKRKLRPHPKSARYCYNNGSFIIINSYRKNTYFTRLDFGGNQLAQYHLPYYEAIDPYCSADGVYFTHALDEKLSLIRKFYW